VSIVGLLMLVTVIPVNTSGNCNFRWDQVTGQDFAADTMTDVHVCNWQAGQYFVHLTDNESSTYDFSYANPATAYPIWDEVKNQLVGTFSQSFTPNINGVVDKVDLYLYRVGTPKTLDGADAKLYIKIVDANQNGIHAPIMNSVKTEWYYLPAYVPINVGLNTYTLSEFDSCYCSPLTSGTIYDLVVTSDAAQNQVPGNNYYMKANNQDTGNTDGCTKKYVNLQPTWVATAFDFPFKIYDHNFKHSGTLLSCVHDCLQQVTFSETSIDHRQGGTPTLYVRTGPTSPPDLSWTDWVNQGTGSQNPGLMPNRYVQFQVEFVAGANDLTTDGVDIVHIGWL
jgi:hypothetical protein